MWTQHYLSFLVKILGDYRFTVLQLRTLIKWYSIQISIIHDNISSQLADKRRYEFGQWMKSSVVHDHICSLTHKKCHPTTNDEIVEGDPMSNPLQAIHSSSVNSLNLGVQGRGCEPRRMWIRATSHTSQELWPWNCKSPKESVQRLSQHTSKIMPCDRALNEMLLQEMFIYSGPHAW